MRYSRNNYGDKKDYNNNKDNRSKNVFLQKSLKLLNNYKPLIVIFIFCLLIPIAQITPFDLQKFMYYMMGYFFILLSLFKFFDLRGFVEGFATYDLIAKRFRIYGYVYPFIEFSLGMAYFAQINLVIVNWITLITMLVSGAGVLNGMLSGQKIKCACLGTVLTVPLSTVSILENFSMAAMATYNLI